MSIFIHGNSYEQDSYHALHATHVHQMAIMHCMHVMHPHIHHMHASTHIKREKGCKGNNLYYYGQLLNARLADTKVELVRLLAKESCA